MFPSIVKTSDRSGTGEARQGSRSTYFACLSLFSMQYSITGPPNGWLVAPTTGICVSAKSSGEQFNKIRKPV